MIRFYVNFPGRTPYLYGVLSIESGVIFFEDREKKFHGICSYMYEFQEFCKKTDPDFRLVWIDKQ